MAAEELAISVPSWGYMLSAFLAMEPPDVVISFARELGGGSITGSVQSRIWHHCLSRADGKVQGPYVKRFLKKLIYEVESSGGLVLDELYEQCASYMISVKDHDADDGSSRVLKMISFLYPTESCGILTCPKSNKLEVQLQCSVNMLEGDTGCSIWPSSLFLSEFILSFPEIFRNKCCFELGSGVGLVGICLSHVKASKIILTDGDFSTLANMKINLELNHLSSTNHVLHNDADHNMVQCVFLPWESTSKDELRQFTPDIILGADIIYDPSCLPHLVRVLSILLNERKHSHVEVNTKPDAVAYIASVIRNIDTFNYFHELAGQANLIITDLTQTVQVCNFLPYLRSYDRPSVRMFRIHM